MPRVEFDIPSGIEEVNKSALLLCEWIGKSKIRLEQVYNSLEHGTSKKQFDSKILGTQTPSVIFMKSEKGQVFGAYTTVHWNAPENDDTRYRDDEAFLFSLTKKSKHKVYQNEMSTVRHWKNQYLFFFGSGCDIGIVEYCDTKKDSWSKLGGTFSLPEGMMEDSEEAKQYLAGEFCFKVTEIEIYKV